MGVDVGKATGYLDLDISGFLKGLKTAQEESEKQTKSMADKMADGFKSVGQSLTSAGSTITKGVTTPIVGLGTTIVKVSSDFESSMSKVQAISGATGDDFEALKAKAGEMGATTKFSASEAAEAFQYMAMAGWDTENMLGGISGVMNLAAASGESLGTVSDIVTDAMTAFGMSAAGTSKVLRDGVITEVDNTTRFVDALAAASNSSNTNVSMLGESFKYIAPVAGSLGYSVEDTAVALGLMANQGIKASQAGTALRTLLTNMVNPTDTMEAAMYTLGLELEDEEGNMKSLMEVMQDLRTGFGGGRLSVEEFQWSAQDLNKKLTEGSISAETYEIAVNDLMVAMYGAEGAQKAQLAAQLAGKEGMSGLLAIIGTTEEDFNSLTESIYNASGTSQEMADIMNDNLAGQLVLLKSALEALAIQFGEVLLPAVKKVVEWIQALVAKMQELSPEQKEQIVKWAAIAAAIGPVLLVLGKLVTSVGSIIATFSQIPAVLTKVKAGFALLKGAIAGISAPVAAVVAVIAVLVAAFKHLWDTNEEFRQSIIEIWDGIKSKIDEFTKGIVDRLNALGFEFESITEVLSAAWNAFCELLGPIFEGVLTQLGNTLGLALDVLTGILDIFIGIFTGNWEQVWNGIKEIFGGVWTYVKETFVNWIETFKGLADVIFGWFGTTWENCWNSVREFFVGIWDGIVSFFTNTTTSIVNGVSNFIESVIEFFAELPTNIANFITNAYNSVVAWVSNMVAKAKEMGQNFLNMVIEFFTDLPYKVGYFIGLALTNVVIWAANMIQKAKEMAQNFLNNIVSFFTQLPGKIQQFITSAWNNVVKWATDMVNKAKEMAQNFLNNIVSFFTQLPGKIKEFITTAYNNVVSWASDMVNKARDTARDFLNNIVNTIRDLPSNIKKFLDDAIANVGKWGTDMLTKGKEAVTSLLSGVGEAALSIPGKMAEIGEDIVNGVWEGIKKAKDNFVKSVKDFFSGIVDGVKEGLGIASPSKVFRDEVGRWLPAGVAVGFESAMPAAMRQIQNSLDDGIDSIEADDISVEAISGVSAFADKVKSIYSQVALWFESIEDRVGSSIDGMMDKLQLLINTSKEVVTSGGTLGYIGYGGFTPKSNGGTDKEPTGGTGDRDVTERVYIIQSKERLSEKETVKEIRDFERDLSEGFI